MITRTVSTLATEQAAPMDRSIEPSSRIAVMPDAMMIRGAESLNRVFRFACPKKRGCTSVKPATSIMMAEKLKYRMTFS